MTTDLLSLLSLYLVRQIELPQVRDWISLNVWNANQHERELIDRVSVELAYLDDGLLDEQPFRDRLLDAITPTVFQEIKEVTDYRHNALIDASTIVTFTSIVLAPDPAARPQEDELNLRVDPPDQVEDHHLAVELG